jgi:formylglycine-generating enzyme required for sulfatase activity
MKAGVILVLAAVILAAIGGCTPKEPAKQFILDLGNKVTMKLVLIPAGKFIMGSPKTEKDRGENEVQHEVTISKPFYMGIYAVTQKQYEQIMVKTPSFIKGAQNPVETVSWDDAVEFCKALSQKTGKRVTLPTEAQWEYACRAGSTTRFSYGDDNEYANLGDYAWYLGNITHPVGQKKPNAWGLYDMHGNVEQWCSDWYAEDYYANSTKTDPTGAASGTYRVMRGGCCFRLPQYCRSAFRNECAPVYRHYSIGFRVVVLLDSK